MSGGFNPALGRRPTIEWIPLGELRVDEAYQRSIDAGSPRKHVEQIARTWNWDLCLVLAVSRRPDDSLWVVDGQHRLAAARLRGDIDALPCCVARRDGPADEAAMFRDANRWRRPVSSLERFHAAVAAGDASEVAVWRIATDAGLTIPRKVPKKEYGPGEIGVVTGLLSLLGSYGAPLLDDTLRAVGEAFRGQPIANPAAIIGAVASLFYNPAGVPVDHSVLVEELGALSPAKWSELADLRNVRGGAQRLKAVRRILLLRLGAAESRANRAPVAVSPPPPPRRSESQELRGKARGGRGGQGNGQREVRHAAR